MANVFYNEFENENGGILYPFSEDCDPFDENGVRLPDDLFIDAVLYPEDEECYLSSLSWYSGSRIVNIKSGEHVLTGNMQRDSKYVELFDENGVHRGTLATGRSLEDVLDDPTDRVFTNLRFCSACQFTVPADGVRSLRIRDVSMTGEVEFQKGSDSISISTTTTGNEDGSCNLRFDVAANAGILATSNTGVRSIHFLRLPDSYLNVLDKDGQPYLYLTKDGTTRNTSLIDRDDVCSIKGASRTSAVSAESSSKDNCGKSSGSGSGGGSGSGSGYGDCSCADYDWIVKYDPEKDSNGFFGIPAVNGFTGGTTMAVLFIECAFRVRFFVYPAEYGRSYGGQVVACVNYKYTTAAQTLFLGKEPTHAPSDNEFCVPLKPDKYEQFYEYFYNNRKGGFGYITEDYFTNVAVENGWYSSYSENNVPDGEDPVEFCDNKRNELKDLGFTKSKPLYYIRARDFFEHFECKNWEIANSDFTGDEVRYLVGWYDGHRVFAGGGRYVEFAGADGKSVKLPMWLVSRYVWWKKYSKNGNELRHFIVPKERGLVIYTGDYWCGGNKDLGTKEVSVMSWECPFTYRILAINGAEKYGVTDLDGSSLWMFYKTMRERLHKEYQPGFDPTYGDNTFYYIDKSTFEKVEVTGVSVETMDYYAQRADNRVVEGTKVMQPLYDAPIAYTDVSTEDIKCGRYLGPFKYEYDKTYIVGLGYPDTSDIPDDAIESDAVKAPIVFRFDITKNNKNAFNFNTTDMTATGMAYKNPIHVEVVESSVGMSSLNISDPTDIDEVSGEIKKITEGVTTGNGIQLSIPGLGAV